MFKLKLMAAGPFALVCKERFNPTGALVEEE